MPLTFSVTSLTVVAAIGVLHVNTCINAYTKLVFPPHVAAISVLHVNTCINAYTKLVFPAHMAASSVSCMKVF